MIAGVQPDSLSHQNINMLGIIIISWKALIIHILFSILVFAQYSGDPL